MLTFFNSFDQAIYEAYLNLAKQKYFPAFYCLGRVNERGIGIKVDKVAAWAWFYIAFSVDGIHAKSDLDRVSTLLNTKEEIAAKLLADQYIKRYTNFNETPSMTIIK